MKFTFTCKKISLNDSVKAYAEKKIGKLEKYFKEEPEATVTFAVEKKNRCIVEVMLRGANGTLFRAVCEDADGDMRGAIDEAVSQIDRKIRKNKTRLAKNLRSDAIVPEVPEEFDIHEARDMSATLESEAALSTSTCRCDGAPKPCRTFNADRQANTEAMMARMKELEDENRRLKKMYLEEKLKAEIANEYLAKK